MIFTRVATEYSMPLNRKQFRKVETLSKQATIESHLYDKLQIRFNLSVKELPQADLLVVSVQNSADQHNILLRSILQLLNS